MVLPDKHAIINMVLQAEKAERMMNITGRLQMQNTNLWAAENMDAEKREEFLTKLEEAKHWMAYYQCAIMEIETKFNVLNTQFSVQQDYNPIENIKSRLKSPESILGKMQRKNLPMDFDLIEKEIQDIAGVRVICPFVTDIYMLADCLLEQDDIRLIECKDYIRNPKENGYRSLHLIVEIPIFLRNEKKLMKVEIQFRTIAMNFWASLEHRMRYKKELPEEVSEQIAAELKACAEDSAQLDVRMEKVKNTVGAQNAH